MMETNQPLNPYLALGVAKDATAADIKSAYRRLVLKCHPDKVSDESLKAEKQKEFHNIQEAYELIGEEEKRHKYDAQARLEELRKDVFAQKSAGARPEKYNIRTAVPPWASYNFPPHPQPSFDNRRGPSFAFFDEDDFYREGSWTSSRKYELYEPVPSLSSKRSSPRTERTKSKTKSGGAGDRSRSDRRKSREQETRRDRDGKFAYVDEDSYPDERMRYEDGYRRRNEEERRRERFSEEQTRQHQQPQQHKRHHSASETDKSVESEDDHYTSQWHKMHSQTSSARDYIERRRANGSVSLDPETASPAHRPSMNRSASSTSARYVDVRRSSDSRPSTVRRSSARSKDPNGSSSHDRSHHSSSSVRHKDRDRDRKGTMPEIVEYPAERPSRRTHSSIAATGEELRLNGVRRSHTSIDDIDRRSSDQNVPSVSIRRADTMPVKSSSSVNIPTSPLLAPHSSSKRKESHPANSSKLRTSEQADDSGYSSPNSDKVVNGGGNSVPSTTSTRYIYNSSGDNSSARFGVTFSPGDEPNRYRTVVREPTSVSTPKLSRGATFTANSTIPISHSRSRSRSRSRERDRDRRHRKTETPRAAARPAPQPLQPGDVGGSSSAHSQQLFGEISPTAHSSNSRPSHSTPVVPPSFRSSKSMPTYKGEVSYGKRFGPEDILYWSRKREEMGKNIIEQVKGMAI